MVLTVADIQRWDSEAVREVYHAATSRGTAALDAADGLARLPAWETWGGKAAEAAGEAVRRTRLDLDARGQEALAVARAADMAADGIENVKGRLAALQADAKSEGVELDPYTDTFVPGQGFRGNAHTFADIVADLQPRLNAILVDANAVDEELAHAINMADGEEPIPAGAGPPVGQGGLTPTQIASDGNQERLLETRAETQAHLDDLQHRYDTGAAQTYMQGDADPTTMTGLQGIADQIAATKGRLGELDSVDQALGRAPETYLTQLAIPGDPTRKVLAAVAVGNPDTASKISVTVPGIGSTTKDTLPEMVSEASDLRDTTQNELRRLGIPGSVSTIAWMGYTPPPNGWNTGIPSDLWADMHDAQAQIGAPNLASYLETVRANSPDAQITLLGHSYGSLTSSLALQQLHAEGIHAVDDVVFYGSPGLELNSPEQLGLAPGHAFVMQAPNDRITEFVAPLAPAHGWGADPYTPGLFPELSSQAGTSPDGVVRMGVGGHADYPRDGINQVLRMSGYNFAAVIAGLPPNQLVMAPPAATDQLPPAPWVGK